MMRAAEIFDVDEMVLLERSFQDLTNPYALDRLLLPHGHKAKLLVDKDEIPLALAREDNGWVAASFIWKEPTDDLIELLPELEIEVIEAPVNIWQEAVMEHFSLKMLDGCQPSVNDLVEGRLGNMASLLSEVWGNASGVCYDCCCGTGVGSAALEGSKLTPIAFDIDRSLLCRGLLDGRLMPWNTALLDATRATEYFSPAPHAMCLMAGSINDINKWQWEMIIKQVISLGKKVMITFAEERETKYVEEWTSSDERELSVLENERDPFYDRWVCLLE